MGMVNNKNISIHTLRMEGDKTIKLSDIGIMISIHTLRMEGDYLVPFEVVLYKLISIHTLRMEGDRV